MFIPISHRTALSAQQFAEEVRVDVQHLDKGLDFTLVHEHGDHAHYGLTRQGQPRAWDFILYDDGSAILRHRRYGTHRCGTVASFHETLKCIVREGHD